MANILSQSGMPLALLQPLKIPVEHKAMRSETGRRQSPPTSRCFHPPSFMQVSVRDSTTSAAKCLKWEMAAETWTKMSKVGNGGWNMDHVRYEIRDFGPTSFELPSQRRTSTAIPKSTRPKLVLPSAALLASPTPVFHIYARIHMHIQMHVHVHIHIHLRLFIYLYIYIPMARKLECLRNPKFFPSKVRMRCTLWG